MNKEKKIKKEMKEKKRRGRDRFVCRKGEKKRGEERFVSWSGC